MKQVLTHYEQLQKNSTDVLHSLISNEDLCRGFVISHNSIRDYEALLAVIVDRPESAMFLSAIREYQFALSALTNGQYRYAFVGLRLAFELTLASIQFSAHEIDFRMWEQGAKDVNWNAIKNNETGIFSKNFIGVFNRPLAENGAEYGAIAERVYRECSEFVHGNISTHTDVTKSLSFDQAIIEDWISKSAIIKLVIVFSFSVRYLCYLDVTRLESIRSILTDSLGHLGPIREHFQK